MPLGVFLCAMIWVYAWEYAVCRIRKDFFWSRSDFAGSFRSDSGSGSKSNILTKSKQNKKLQTIYKCLKLGLQYCLTYSKVFDDLLTSKLCNFQHKSILLISKKNYFSMQTFFPDSFRTRKWNSNCGSESRNNFRSDFNPNPFSFLKQSFLFSLITKN